MVRHYFAFGSNMNPARVRARGLPFDRIEAGWLSGFRLTFDKVGADHPDSGHAHIAWAPGERVEGVLYRLPDPNVIRQMDPYERAPVNYSREVFFVESAQGPVASWTYVANPAVLQRGRRPERAYLDHLLAGRPWLSAAYWQRLAAWPVIEDGDVR